MIADHLEKHIGTWDSNGILPSPVLTASLNSLRDACSNPPLMFYKRQRACLRHCKSGVRCRSAGSGTVRSGPGSSNGTKSQEGCAVISFHCVVYSALIQLGLHTDLPDLASTENLSPADPTRLKSDCRKIVWLVARAVGVKEKQLADQICAKVDTASAADSQE